MLVFLFVLPYSHKVSYTVKMKNECALSKKKKMGRQITSKIIINSI